MVRSHGPAGAAGRSIFIDFAATGVPEVFCCSLIFGNPLFIICALLACVKG